MKILLWNMGKFSMEMAVTPENYHTLQLRPLLGYWTSLADNLRLEVFGGIDEEYKLTEYTWLVGDSKE